jgi:hypothetical protein
MTMTKLGSSRAGAGGLCASHRRAQSAEAGQPATSAGDSPAGWREQSSERSERSGETRPGAVYVSGSLARPLRGHRDEGMNHMTAVGATLGRLGNRLGARAAVVPVVLGLLLAACHKAPYPDVTAETKAFGGETGHATRVYLSSPRHASSGSRGECGWEENVNGRTANMWTATADTASYKGLAGRDYLVYVSANARDDGYLLNRQESNNLGAQVHIPTHTNANGAGCGDAAQYVLVMFKEGDAKSAALKDQLLAKLDPVVPGHKNSWNCFGQLAECSANAPHVAYVELFFHTNKAAADWFMGPHDGKCAEGCGWQAGGKGMADAIDDHLGNPRAVSDPAAFALDGYEGFGRSAEAVLRDDTIAYTEAFQREVRVVSCMSDAGFDYAPAVAFPAERVADIAAGLGVRANGAAPAPPASRNRTYVQSLSIGDRERYYQSLLAESAVDVAEAERTGEIPRGRGPGFATGGCLGAAETAIPSIWDRQRPLRQQLDEDIAASAELGAARSHYRQCAQAAGGIVASDPGDARAVALVDSAKAKAVAAVLADCEAGWATDYDRAASTVAERFAEGHADELSAIKRHYDTALRDISHDDGFLTYLSEQAALAEG